MSDLITHLIITEFEVDIYKIVIFQDREGKYLTMNIDFII